MGTQQEVRSNLAEALFPAVQLRVLGLLFGQPDRSFQGAELIRLVGSGAGAAHRVLTRLVESGLATVTPIGNQKHYRANSESPIYEELRGLIAKTVGIVAPLQLALAPLAEQIRAAFVYGSLAKGTDTAKSDVDLMIIGDGLDYPEVYRRLQEVESGLGRTINPTLYTAKEFRRRRKEGHFVERVLSQPRLWVIRNDGDVA